MNLKEAFQAQNKIVELLDLLKQLDGCFMNTSIGSCSNVCVIY